MRVFVTQRWGGGGVLLVPKAQLAALREDGYREATAAEVAVWYGERRPAPPGRAIERVKGHPVSAGFAHRWSSA